MSTIRDDLAKLDDQARARLTAVGPPTPAEEDLHRRDGAAFDELKAELRRRFPGKRFIHHLDDAEFVALVDWCVSELAADPADLDRRARLYAAESGRRLIAQLRRDRDAAKTEAARPERERLREEIKAAECGLEAAKGHSKALALNLDKLRLRLAELVAGDAGEADEPQVVEVRAG
jgi:hypothetical protein